MEANELMLGDWVSYRGIYTKVALADFGIGDGHAKWRKEIKPIPLTKEMLTKNGFKALNGRDNHFVLVDGYTIAIDYMPAMKVDGYDLPQHFFLSINFADSDMCKEIEYIHELQHFLRMFNTDKEIEL